MDGISQTQSIAATMHPEEKEEAVKVALQVRLLQKSLETQKAQSIQLGNILQGKGQHIDIQA
jgi:hypothetical protein